MTEAVRFTYVGPASLVGDLAETLKDAGIVVEYRPPFETKDMATALAAVSVVLAATGSLPDVVRLARTWVTRRPGTRVEGLPEAQARGSVQDRLKGLDRLLADGAVTQEERDAQRSRVLGEL